MDSTSLQARAEIFTKISLFFGRFRDTKMSFRNYWHLASIEYKTSVFNGLD